MRRVTLVTLFVLSVAAVVWSASVCEAGPVRDWINDHRPGWIVPKPQAPAIPFPQPMPANPCPGGVCPIPANPAPAPQPCPAQPCPGFDRIPPGGVEKLPPPCPGGKCPLKPAPAEKTFTAMPVGNITVTDEPN